MRYRLELVVLLDVRFFGVVVWPVDFLAVDFTVLLPVLLVDLLTVFTGVLVEAEDVLAGAVLVFVVAMASMRG